MISLVALVVALAPPCGPAIADVVASVDALRPRPLPAVDNMFAGVQAEYRARVEVVVDCDARLRAAWLWRAHALFGYRSVFELSDEAAVAGALASVDHLLALAPTGEELQDAASFRGHLLFIANRYQEAADAFAVAIAAAPVSRLAILSHDGRLRALAARESTSSTAPMPPDREAAYDAFFAAAARPGAEALIGDTAAHHRVFRAWRWLRSGDPRGRPALEAVAAGSGRVAELARSMIDGR